jgi:DHA1 family inner membrane transport protein
MTEPYPPRRPPLAHALMALAFANFVTGMGAFAAIGVLGPFSRAFDVDKATGGWLMTSYAITYAIASPVLVSLTGERDRRQVINLGLGFFLVGSLAVALSSTFAGVMIGRALMACGGGLITPVSAAVGVALAEPSQRGRVLSAIFGGLTLAQVAGVPTGAWLGYAFGWQAAFVVVALLSILAFAATLRVIPRGIASPPTNLATLGKVLMTPILVIAVSYTAFFIGGIYVVYTYMTPLFETRFGLGRDGVTAMLALAGLGAILGNVTGGRLADRMEPTRALAMLGALQVILMPLVTLAPLTLYPFAALALAWSVSGWSFMVLQQSRLSQLSPSHTPVLFALNAACIYVGGSIGGLAGGVVLRSHGLDWLGVGGAAIVMLALATLALVARLSRPSRAPSRR